MSVIPQGTNPLQLYGFPFLLLSELSRISDWKIQSSTKISHSNHTFHVVLSTLITKGRWTSAITRSFSERVVERNKTHFICCAVLGLMRLFGGVLRVYYQINFSIASCSVVERVFCGYMKSVVLSQQCAVTAFGERFYFIELHWGQSVTVSFISDRTEEKPVRFSVNIEPVYSLRNNPLISRTVLCVRTGV